MSIMQSNGLSVAQMIYMFTIYNLHDTNIN